MTDMKAKRTGRGNASCWNKEIRSDGKRGNLGTLVAKIEWT